MSAETREVQHDRAARNFLAAHLNEGCDLHAAVRTYLAATTPPAPGAEQVAPALAVDQGAQRLPSWSTPDALTKPTRAPSEGAETLRAVTDDDVRHAVCAYNKWDYAVMGEAVSLRDMNSIALRRVLEDFALRAALRGEGA